MSLSKVSLLFFLLVLLSAFSAQAENQCKDLYKAQAVAQTAYNKALGAWKQATVRASQAEWNLNLIGERMATNDNKQFIAETELAIAEADLELCKSAEDGTGLPPLFDCKMVPGRINKAKNDIAACEALRKKLEEEQAAAQQKLEAAEDEAAAAHAAEMEAWAALEQAKAAAADCELNA